MDTARPLVSYSALQAQVEGLRAELAARDEVIAELEAAVERLSQV